VLADFSALPRLIRILRGQFSDKCLKKQYQPTLMEALSARPMQLLYTKLPV
jgi:hypothetical protein